MNTAKTFFLAVLLSLTFSAQAQQTEWAWNYQMNGVSSASGTQRPGSGQNKAELFKEKDGTYTFRIRGNTAPACFSTAEPAKVEETEATWTITPTGRFANCEKIRFVIKKDGSGGIQQNLVGKKGNTGWEEDENTNLGLTAR